jgi:hypothetical protein
MSVRQGYVQCLPSVHKAPEMEWKKTHNVSKAVHFREV